MSKPKITITDWDTLQHKFTDDRKVLWVKLYVNLRGDRRWRRMSDAGCKLYIDLVMLAADEKPYGVITLSADEIAWDLRSEPADVVKALHDVVKSGLVSASGYEFDVKMISSGHQDDDSPDVEKSSLELEERREEKRTTLVNEKGWSDDVVHVDLPELMLFCDDFGIPYEEMNATLEKLQATELLPIR